MNDVKGELARDIIHYVMSHDILTQHGMKGLRDRLAIAIPEDIAVIYGAMLNRASKLMGAKMDTREGAALDLLAEAIQDYERYVGWDRSPRIDANRCPTCASSHRQQVSTELRAKDEGPCLDPWHKEYRMDGTQRWQP